jgi:hypothetical protein
MGPDGAQNQGRLCWRGPAAIYWILKINIYYSPASLKYTNFHNPMSVTRRWKSNSRLGPNFLFVVAEFISLQNPLTLIDVSLFYLTVF